MAQMPHQSSELDKRESALPFNLSAIALLVLLLGLGIAYALDALVNKRTAETDSIYAAPYIGQILAGTSLRIPKAWFHAPVPKDGEFADQIDLRVYLRFDASSELIPIDLRMVPTSRAQPSAYLLDAVYLRRFSSDQVNGPAGLVGKPLRDEDGFQNETVWYDPLSSRPFVAKCIDTLEEGKTAMCLRTVHLSGQIAAIYQFEAGVLLHWKDFDRVLEPWLAQIGVPIND